MDKKYLLIISAMLLLALFVTSCQPAVTVVPTTAAPVSAAPTAAPTTAPAKKTLKVAALLPGVITDGSWNQQAYEGLQKAQKDCGISFAYSENVTQDAQLELVRNYALQNYDIIIGHGGEYDESFNTIEPQFPNLQFVVTNGVTGKNNISSIKFDYFELGYIACSLACQMTKTNKIGIVQGDPIPILLDSAAACQQALNAKECGKKVDLITVKTGSWDDVAKAREASLALIAQKVDVLWQNLDAADAGVFSAAVDKKVYAIGQYVDQSNLGPSAYIGSASASVVDLVYQSACGNASGGKIVAVGVKGGMGIIMSNLVPPETQQLLNSIVDKIKSGEIVVNKTR